MILTFCFVLSPFEGGDFVWDLVRVLDSRTDLAILCSTYFFFKALILSSLLAGEEPAEPLLSTFEADFLTAFFKLTLEADFRTIPAGMTAAAAAAAPPLDPLQLMGPPVAGAAGGVRLPLSSSLVVLWLVVVVGLGWEADGADEFTLVGAWLKKSSSGGRRLVPGDQNIHFTIMLWEIKYFESSVLPLRHRNVRKSSVFGLSTDEEG